MALSNDNDPLLWPSWSCSFASLSYWICSPLYKVITRYKLPEGLSHGGPINAGFFISDRTFCSGTYLTALCSALYTKFVNSRAVDIFLIPKVSYAGWWKPILIYSPTSHWCLCIDKCVTWSMPVQSGRPWLALASCRTLKVLLASNLSILFFYNSDILGLFFGTDWLQDVIKTILTFLLRVCSRCKYFNK